MLICSAWEGFSMALLLRGLWLSFFLSLLVSWLLFWRHDRRRITCSYKLIIYDGICVLASFICFWTSLYSQIGVADPKAIIILSILCYSRARMHNYLGKDNSTM